MRSTVPSPSRPVRRPQRPVAALVALAVSTGAILPLLPAVGAAPAVGAGPEHLVVSEVVTGGASASDELIELHNPTGAALPLEGLEVVYVTASGATISRRAAWPLGAPTVPARGHLLIANETGIYAGVADALYVSGMAATGGSVAVRIQGASSAIDSVGWGTAASTWLEGTPAAAPAAATSIERLPGGDSGSAQDTNDNATDFVQRADPQPQNLGSTPTPDPAASSTAMPTETPKSSPGPTGSPGASSTPVPTAQPTPVPTSQPTHGPTLPPTPTPGPGPASITIADARSAPDGSRVTVEGVALTGSDFHDGGGFVIDPSGGIAVLIADGTFARGDRLRISGEVDDRFSQRTLRADASGIVALGSGTLPGAIGSATGALGEGSEGRLVRVTGTVVGSPSQLSTGIALDLDDGSGAARVVVGTATGISTGSWEPGLAVTLLGVVGQRDSTGSGTEGYRLLPRDPADVIAVGSGGSPSPSGDVPPGDVVTIAAAREAAPNARLRIRGVVTLPTGLVDDGVAVLQDASGAIVLRLLGGAGSVARGARIDVEGARSTLGGMETLRVTKPPTSLGRATEPAPARVSTGSLGEPHEALLVSARGAVTASARGSSSGTVSFEINDGSGPIRVSASPALALDRSTLAAGTWVEVVGVLGQETTRARPTEGYRIWPRSSGDVRVVAPATDAEPPESSEGAEGGRPVGGGGPARLDAALEAADLARLRVGATLVAGPWPELGVAGVLWDGARLALIDSVSTPIVARLTDGGAPPLSLDLGGLSVAGRAPSVGASLVRLGSGPADVVVLGAPPSRPRGSIDGPLPAWVSLIGRLSGTAGQLSLQAGGDAIGLELRCGEKEARKRALDGREGSVMVTAIAFGAPARLVTPCEGIRRAPELSPGPVARGTRSASSTDAPASTSATTGEPGDPRRGPAGGLLLLAAVALAVTAWLRRRAGAAASGPVEPAESATEEPSATPLTLVRVRNERGS